MEVVFRPLAPAVSVWHLDVWERSPPAFFREASLLVRGVRTCFKCGARAQQGVAPLIEAFRLPTACGVVEADRTESGPEKGGGMS